MTARSGATAASQDLDHGLAGLGVERGGGLVADDEPRRVDEGAGDRDALLLAA